MIPTAAQIGHDQIGIAGHDLGITGHTLLGMGGHDGSEYAASDRNFFLQTMGRRESTRVHASSAALPSGTDTVEAEDLSLWACDHAADGRLEVGDD